MNLGPSCIHASSVVKKSMCEIPKTNQTEFGRRGVCAALSLLEVCVQLCHYSRGACSSVITRGLCAALSLLEV